MLIDFYFHQRYQPKFLEMKEKIKCVCNFRKTLILHIWKGSEYVFGRPSKVFSPWNTVSTIWKQVKKGNGW